MKRGAILLALFLIPSLVFAIELNLTYPKLPGAPDINVEADQDLAEVILWFYRLFVGITGLAGFLMLLWAGFQYVISAGNPAKIGDARDRAIQALLGILLVLSSFIIIQFINPELTQIGSESLEIVPGPEYKQLLNVSGLIQGNLPAGAAEDGLYLCKKDQCKCDTGKCVESESIADGPDDGFDYLRIDMDAYDPDNGPTDLGKWTNAVTAIGKKGAFDVLIFEYANHRQTGKVVCFNSSVGRLDDFQISSSPDHGWAFDVRSVKKLTEGSCHSPGITLENESSFKRNPVVFLFNEKDFGARVGGSNPRIFAKPCNYFDADSQNKNEDASQGADCAVYSVWISQVEQCGGPDKNAQCAARFYENTPLDYTLKSVDPDNPNPEDKKHNTLCLNSSLSDIRQPKYSFDTDSPYNDIRDDIRGIRILPDGNSFPLPNDCPSSINGIVIFPPLPSPSPSP